MDLGTAWMEEEGLPMIFGVFVARRDTPQSLLKEAHAALISNLAFESNVSKGKRSFSGRWRNQTFRMNGWTNITARCLTDLTNTILLDSFASLSSPQHERRTRVFLEMS